MRYARPGQTVTFTLAGAPAGLLGTVTFELVAETPGATGLPASSTGIRQTWTNGTTSDYAADRVMPAAVNPGGDVYQPKWHNGAAVVNDSDEVTVNASGTEGGVRPSVDEVGALLHARTMAGAADPGQGVALGDELGTFNELTRPTGQQVETLIDMAVSDVAARVGTDVPDLQTAEARRLAALQAAALVEASFFPGEIDTDRSAYRQYTAMYLTGVQALTEDAARPSSLRLV